MEGVAYTELTWTPLHIAHLAARHPNNVRLYFPCCERELWANSAFLSEKSPYFKDLFASDFTERLLKKDSLKLEREDEAAQRMSTFEDSDDETDTAHNSSSPIKSKSEGECGSGFREIIITDTAYTTYRAVLVYLQTGFIDFAPLLSSFENDRSPPSQVARRRLSKVTTTPRSLPFPAPPKSVYRLAHSHSLSQLSALALASLSSQLTPANVLFELFDSVSGVYDEIQKMELAYAAENWEEVKRTSAMRVMEAKVAAGELSHPVGMLLQLAKSLN